MYLIYIKILDTSGHYDPNNIRHEYVNETNLLGKRILLFVQRLTKCQLFIYVILQNKYVAVLKQLRLHYITKTLDSPLVGPSVEMGMAFDGGCYWSVFRRKPFVTKTHYVIDLQLLLVKRKLFQTIGNDSSP